MKNIFFNVKCVKIFLTIPTLSLLLIACGSGDGKSTPSLTQSILISSGDTNHRGITSYLTNGDFENQIIDLRAFESSPMGLASGNNQSFLTSTNGADAILDIPYNDTYEFFYGSAVLNGNIYDIEYGPLLDYFYVVESSNIEVFNSAGERLPTAVIPNNLSPCNLGSPRNMHATDDGFLFVADTGNNRIHKFDISNHTATCDDSYLVTGLQPYGVHLHSNGLLYLTSFADDAVYTLNPLTLTLTNIFEPGTSVLNNPTAIAELNDGNLLIASSITDSIELIDPSGVRQGLTPFIQDIYSLNVTDIEVLNRVDTFDLDEEEVN